MYVKKIFSTFLFFLVSQSFLANVFAYHRHDLESAEIIKTIIRKNNLDRKQGVLYVRHLKKNSLFKSYGDNLEIYLNNKNNDISRCLPTISSTEVNLSKFMSSLTVKCIKETIDNLKGNPSKLQQQILAFSSIKDERKLKYIKYLTNIDVEESEFQNSTGGLATEDFNDIISFSPKLMSLLPLMQESLNAETIDQLNQSTYLDKSESKYFKSEFSALVNNLMKKTSSLSYQELETFKNEIMSFYFYNKKYIPDSYAFDRLSSIGKRYSSLGHIQNAQELFQFTGIIGKASQKHESMFLILWNFINNQDFDSAKDYIEKNKLYENAKELPQNLTFWAAYALEKTDPSKSSELYKITSNGSVFSYYTALALNKLGEKLTFKSEAPRLKLTKDIQGKIKNSLQKAEVWLEVGLISFAFSEVYNELRDELYIKGEFQAALTDLTLEMLHDLCKKNKSIYLLLFKLAYSFNNDSNYYPSENVFKLLFPKEHFSTISRYSEKIEPYLILSLIRQESAFNPQARSHVGARGLMQVMPQTAQYVTGKKNIIKRLEHPETSIEIGATYLRKMLDRFNGNIVYTLASYNAGPHRVTQWQETNFVSESTLAQIEAIPFEETRNYVKLIMRNYFIYKSLYGGELEDLVAWAKKQR